MPNNLSSRAELYWPEAASAQRPLGMFGTHREAAAVGVIVVQRVKHPVHQAGVIPDIRCVRKRACPVFSVYTWDHAFDLRTPAGMSRDACTQWQHWKLPVYNALKSPHMGLLAYCLDKHAVGMSQDEKLAG